MTFSDQLCCTNRLPESLTEENWIHESATGIAFTNRRVKEALFNRAASAAAAAAGVEVQWYSGEYVCEPCCAMVIICLLVSSRPLFLCCYVILVCYTLVLDSFLPHWRNEVKS